MGAADIAIATAVLSAAFWLIYRSLWKAKGACHGCSSGGSCRPPEQGGSGVVRLKRRADGARDGGP